MKKIIYLFAFLFSFAFPGLVAAENIDSFHGDYNLPKSGVIEVKETIKYNFGNEYRHGIYRYIPYKYHYDNGETVYINISRVNVEDGNGRSVEYEESTSNGNIVLKIGNSNLTITGEHTYVISYKVKGGIRYYDSGDEFFWNVNGTGWNVSADSVSATVNVPDDIDEKDIKTACWVGGYGSTTQCDDQNIVGRAITFTSQNLDVNEGLSFDVVVPAGTFEVVSAGFRGSGIPDGAVLILVVIALFIPLITFIFMLSHWWKKGRDPKGKGTIVAEYSAPDELTPIEVGTLLDNKVDNKDLSAEIIYLAVKGYLKITKEEKKFLSGNDYLLIKKKNGKGLDNVFDASLYSGIFSNGDVIKMSSLKSNFYTYIASIKTSVHDKMVSDGYFKEKVTTTIWKYVAIGAALGVVGAGLFGATGSFTNGLTAFIFIPSFIVSSLIVIGFGLVMPARTKKGVLVKEKILGLKEYMKVAESDRLKFHNAPEKTPEKFEELLPYAMVLGVEKEWAKQFENIYKSNPEWYDDPTGRGFTPIIFVNNMSSFSSAVTTNMTTPPASSGSGLSGGGFSGGGFGGGGGGSW